VRLPASAAVYKEVEELTTAGRGAGESGGGSSGGGGSGGCFSGSGGGGSGGAGGSGGGGGGGSGGGVSTTSWWATDGEGVAMDDPAASALRAGAAKSGRVTARYVVLPLPAPVPALKAGGCTSCESS
jgi:hypothetical protein